MINIQYKQFEEIDDHIKWVEIKPIERGRSEDLKYYIQRTNGDEILLRLNDISYYEKARRDAIFAYDVYQKTRLNMNIPIEVGACSDDRLVYTLLTWVSGEDAYDRIRNMHIPLQHRCGISAGKILRQIHSINAPADILPWEAYFGTKLDDYINRFNSYGIQFQGADKAIEYLQNNRHLLVNRPMCALHGDYHSGNLVIDKKGNIGIIDFNRWLWGDPYYDFRCIQLSDTKAFMKGQVEGYFGSDGIPPDFFALLLYYSAAQTIMGIVDANAFGEEAVGDAVKTAQQITRSFDFFQNMIPDWYY